MTRYVFGRRLGGGGMAEVFEAVAHGLGAFTRRVAVKRIRPQLASDNAVRAAFFDEAIIASAMHHANIVSILDYGDVDGAPFQVFELVEGLNLWELRGRLMQARRPITEQLALAIGLSVTHALAYAHALTDENGEPRRIVHRDITPKNILISWAGDVKLADFGVATATHRTKKTRTGFIKGSVKYMAPEQAAGQLVDPRADVFGLGCVLHWFLRGTSPVEGTANLMSAVAGIDPALDDDISEPVRALLRRATRASLADRTESAEALRREIADALLAPDARAVILEALAASKEEKQPIPRDDLFRASIVLSGEQDGVRCFTAALPLADQQDTKLVPPPASAPKKKRSVRWGAAASIVFAALALTFLVILSLRRGRAEATPHAPNPVSEVRIAQRSIVEEPIEEPVEEAVEQIETAPETPKPKPKQKAVAPPARKKRAEPAREPAPPSKERVGSRLDSLAARLAARGSDACDLRDLETEYLELRRMAAKPAMSTEDAGRMLARIEALSFSMDQIEERCRMKVHREEAPAPADRDPAGVRGKSEH